MTKRVFSQAGFKPAPLEKGHTCPVKLSFILIVKIYTNWWLKQISPLHSSLDNNSLIKWQWSFSHRCIFRFCIGSCSCRRQHSLQWIHNILWWIPIYITIPYNLSISSVLMQQYLCWSLIDKSKNVRIPQKTHSIAFAESLSKPRQTYKQVQLNTLGKTWNKESFGKKLEWGEESDFQKKALYFFREQATKLHLPNGVKNICIQH